MTTTNLTWQVARASGIVSWALLTAAVIWGLLLSNRMFRKRPGPRWLTDLHRFLGGLAVIFVLVHLLALVFDTYLPFGPVQFLVPFTSSWRPTEVTLGVVAVYLLVAVEITSLAKRHISRRAWRAVHMSSYALFVVATAHGLTAGTDSRNPIMWTAYVVAAATVLFLTLLRVLSPRRASASARGNRPSTATSIVTRTHRRLINNPPVRVVIRSRARCRLQRCDRVFSS